MVFQQGKYSYAFEILGEKIIQVAIFDAINLLKLSQIAPNIVIFQIFCQIRGISTENISFAD